MEKLLVNVYVPANERSFDVFVPQDEPVQALMKQIYNGMALLHAEDKRTEGNGIMIHRETQAVMAPEKTLADYHVRDGAQLILL